MSSDATWLAAVVWIFIILFFFYVIFYVAYRGERLADREFIQEQLLEKADILKRVRDRRIGTQFKKERLFNRLKGQYAKADPIELAALLEDSDYLDRVVRNENPDGRFLPFYAPEQIRDELRKDAGPGQSIRDVLQQKLAELQSTVNA